MQQIKVSESTSSRREIPIYLVDDTDGKTAETGVTVSTSDVQIRKAGGSFANFAGTWTEVASGLYTYTPSTGEIDTLGPFVVKVVKSGVRTYMASVQIVSYDPYDSTRLGLTALPNAAASASGGLLTAGTSTNQINTDGAGNVKSDVSKWLTGTPNALQSGRIDAYAGAMASGVITSTVIATDAVTSTGIAASAVNEIADGVLSRNVSNVESSAPEHSLCYNILLATESSISGTTLTVKRTDGSTTFATKTLTTSASADAITGIS